MILRRYPSLGLLPEVIVGIFLLAVIGILGYVLAILLQRAPVAYVPGAVSTGEASPSSPDRHYVEEFAKTFLSYQYTWNHHDFQFRQGQAILMMHRSQQGPEGERVGMRTSLVTDLLQAQILHLGNLTTSPHSPGRWVVEYEGTVSIFYGGVGSKTKPVPIAGALLLAQVEPTSGYSMALVVAGISRMRDETLDTKDGLVDLESMRPSSPATPVAVPTPAAPSSSSLPSKTR